MPTNRISTIFAQAFYSIGDTVWLCHDLTALRKNFPDAIIKTEAPFPEWSGYTLIAPELDVKYSRYDERNWDFTLYNFGDDLSHQFKNEAIEFWKHPKLFRGKSVEIPKMHLLEARYIKLRSLFPGFQWPAAPVMPDIKPYNNFPASFYTKPVATIQTGTSRDEKTYNIEQWEEVAGLLALKGFNIVYIGSPTDPRPSYTNRHIIDMVGTTDLRTTISLIRASSAHLAGDTGTGHIAAAYRVPVVSLFGGFSFPVSCKP